MDEHRIALIKAFLKAGNVEEYVLTGSRNGDVEVTIIDQADRGYGGHLFFKRDFPVDEILLAAKELSN